MLSSEKIDFYPGHLPDMPLPESETQPVKGEGRQEVDPGPINTSDPWEGTASSTSVFPGTKRLKST